VPALLPMGLRHSKSECLAHTMQLTDDPFDQMLMLIRALSLELQELRAENKRYRELLGIPSDGSTWASSNLDL